MPATPKKSKPSKNTTALLRGFKDILPEEMPIWSWAHAEACNLLSDYGYQEIETPILEATTLFKRSIGEETDIVEKEMFTFTDRGRDSVTLRPEMTASLARAYIEHGMFNRPQPVKVWSWGPLFRYDRPQAGRYRQFHQLDLEIFGDAGPVSDAEIIFVAYQFCQALGVAVTVHVNSLGSVESRAGYIKALKDFYRAPSKKRLLCEDCKRRYAKNPLRLLDCKEAMCREVSAAAPQIVDSLDEESKQHFIDVLEHLAEAEIPYVLDPNLVRGLDYYNRTTFEIIPNIAPVLGAPSAPLAVGGGGRYDGLVEILGGRETPAVGMAFGLERLLALVPAEKMPKAKTPQVFLAQLGREAAKHALPLFDKLRRSGLLVSANFAKEGLKNQLELANKAGVPYTVILGQKEMIDGTVIIRDMENGIQETVDLNKVCEEMKKRLKSNGHEVS